MKGIRKSGEGFMTSENKMPIIKFPNRIVQTHKRLLWIEENYPDVKLTFREIARLKRVASDTESLGRLHSYLYKLKSLGAISFEQGSKFSETFRIIFKGNLYDLLKELYVKDNFLMFEIESYEGKNFDVDGETIIFRQVHIHNQPDGTTVLTCRHGKSRVHKVVMGWNGDELITGERYWDKVYRLSNETYTEYRARKNAEKISAEASE